MQSIKISPQFQSNDERNMIALAIGLTFIFAGYLSFVPPLVVYFGMPDKLSASGKNILRQFINFMFNIAILMFVLSISVIGLPLVPVVYAIGIIFTIINLLAVLNNSETNIPILFEALKDSSVINNPPSDGESK